MPFQKGQSGNPGGRPKMRPSVKALAKKHSKAAMLTLAEIIKDKDAAPSARVSAATAILDRAWGKPAQDGTVTISDDRPIGSFTTAELAERTAETLERIERITAGNGRSPEGSNGSANVH